MLVSEIKRELKVRRDDLTKRQNENDLLKRQIGENDKRLLECAERLSIAKDALNFLYELANSRRGVMKSKIEGVVTDALRLIYGNDYKVELSYEIKNNRSSLSIEMVRNTVNGEVRRELGGFGGGVADTISVPLRLMVLLGSKQASRICVLDECYKHVDSERIELVARFLKALADKLNMQIIICTHHDVIRDSADKTYVVSEYNGKSQVVEN